MALCGAVWRCEIDIFLACFSPFSRICEIWRQKLPVAPCGVGPVLVEKVGFPSFVVICTHLRHNWLGLKLNSLHFSALSAFSFCAALSR